MLACGHLIVIHVHRPRCVGSRPVVETRWVISSVAMIAVPPYWRGLEISNSVVLLAMEERYRRKKGFARSDHWSSGGKSCQQRPVSQQQKISMSCCLMLVKRWLFFV